MAKGYNAIEFNAINHDPGGNHPPFGGNNVLPFIIRIDGSRWTGSLSYRSDTEVPDFSQSNEDYWKHVDGLLAYAESKGVLCFMFPSYTGYHGDNEEWMVEMVVTGSSKMQDYGRFIANRYKNQKNIVWMLGGDYGTGEFTFTSDQIAVEKAMLAGMQSMSRQASRNISAEWNQDSIYSDQSDPTLRAAGTLQGAYSFKGAVTLYTRNGYGPFDSDGRTHHPVMPTFLLEEPYDQEGPDGNKVNTKHNPACSSFPMVGVVIWNWRLYL